MSSLRFCSILVFALILAGCDGGRAIVEPKTDCNSRTETTPAECATWTPAGGPYELLSSITMDSLIIEAGTVVRAGAGVKITVDHLIVNGTEANPVLFTALDAGQSWGGISGPVENLVPRGSAELRHVRIENASGALVLATAVIEDTHIVDSRGHAIVLYAGSELTRVTIERADGAGIVLHSASRIRDTVIREAGLGISVGRRTAVRIAGGAIEDNDGDGIATHFEDNLGGSVTFEEPVRITRNGGYPLRVPLSSLRGVLSDEAAQQMMTGNARDTVIAFGGLTWGAVHDGALILHRTLPVRAQVGCLDGLAAMILMPGALLILEAQPCPLNTFGRVLPTVAGTADEPATIHGGGLTVGMTTAIDTARMVHARLHNLNVFSPETPVVMEDVELDSVTLRLDAPGSRLLRVRSVRGGLVTPFGGPTYAAVALGNAGRLEHTIVESAITDGVRITGDGVGVTDCTIRGSAQHGVHVVQGSARVERCNLESNAGDGVHNTTGTAIDATGNWWGDPAGPLGPAGDGVSADVMYDPFSSARLVTMQSARNRARETER